MGYEHTSVFYFEKKKTDCKKKGGWLLLKKVFIYKKCGTNLFHENNKNTYKNDDFRSKSRKYSIHCLFFMSFFWTPLFFFWVIII